MSLRFLIGACCSAIINIGIAVIFLVNHDAMMRSEVWRYVLLTSWLWKVWAGVFLGAALVQIVGIYRDCPNTVRHGTSISIVTKAIWTWGFCVALFDPRINEATGMAQWLTGAAMVYELVFLALPNTPRLDGLVKRAVRRHPDTDRMI